MLNHWFDNFLKWPEWVKMLLLIALTALTITGLALLFSAIVELIN